MLKLLINLPSGNPPSTADEDSPFEREEAELEESRPALEAGVMEAPDDPVTAESKV